MRTDDLKPCAICGTGGRVAHMLAVQELHSTAWRTLLRCAVCGLTYVEEPLRCNRAFQTGEVDLASAWVEQFPDALDVYDDEAWGSRNQDADDVARWQRRAVERLLGSRLDAPGFTLVELGAARGYLLAEIAARHPAARLIGVEPSPVMTEHITRRGGEVLGGVVEDAAFEPESVDAVVAFGAFPQVRDPASTLSFLHRCLKPGGHLLLDSPNDASLSRLLLRTLDRRRRLLARLRVETTLDGLLRLVYNPGRFYYYSPATYSRLLATNGFEVVDVELRPPRYLLYGTGSLGFPRSAAARALMIAERLSRRESWVQVAAVKGGVA